MRRGTLKALFGLVLTLGAFWGNDFVSGGLTGPGVANPAPEFMNAVMCQNMAEPERAPYFRLRLSIRDLDQPIVHFSPFVDMTDRAALRKAQDGCESIDLTFMQQPRYAGLQNPDGKTQTDITGKIKQCGPRGFCLRLDKADIQLSRGHLTVHLGQGVSRTSLAAAVMRFGVVAIPPGATFDLIADLPDGWYPNAPLPEPDLVEAFASTRLTWSSKASRGSSAPTANGRSPMGQLGIFLPLTNTRLKSLETSLLFLLPALFGVGLTLTLEWVAEVARSRAPDAASHPLRSHGSQLERSEEQVIDNGAAASTQRPE